MWAQSIRVTRSCLKERQGLFITTFQRWWEMLRVDNIMDDSLVALICKTKFGKDLQRFFCPPKIGIAKSLVRDASILKYGDSLAGLVVLLTFTQKTIVIVDIAMYADLNPATCYLCDQFRVPTQHYCWNEERRRRTVTLKGVDNGIQGLP